MLFLRSSRKTFTTVNSAVYFTIYDLAKSKCKLKIPHSTPKKIKERVMVFAHGLVFNWRRREELGMGWEVRGC